MAKAAQAKAATPEVKALAARIAADQAAEITEMQGLLAKL
jgi:uncharacterized protein (DUF305 family)